MRKLDGRVAFITGAARGQGRSHAIALAREGADIIAVDVCRDLEKVPYPMATREDMAQTVRKVEELGARIVTAEVDVRDRSGLKAAVDEGVERLGGLDIVLANAGILPVAADDLDPQRFDDVVEVNLTGVFNTVEVSYPHIKRQARGGAIVLTSSTGGLMAHPARLPGGIGYVASKHALVGLMRTYALTLAEHSIRVNTIHPTGVDTPLTTNEAMQKWLASNSGSMAMTNALPIELLQPQDISDAVLWLVSDEARYVTGVALPVDAGFTL
jgi:SDR family mycofactocin-dependent oxidoreductase